MRVVTVLAEIPFNGTTESPLHQVYRPRQRFVETALPRMKRQIAARSNLQRLSSKSQTFGNRVYAKNPLVIGNPDSRKLSKSVYGMFTLRCLCARIQARAGLCRTWIWSAGGFRALEFQKPKKHSDFILQTIDEKILRDGILRDEAVNRHI